MTITAKTGEKNFINKAYDELSHLVVNQLRKYGINDYGIEDIKPNLIRAFRVELGWLLNTKVTDDWYISAIYDVVHLLFFERADKFLGKFNHDYVNGDKLAPFHGYLKLPLTRACQQVSKKYITQYKKFKSLLRDDHSSMSKPSLQINIVDEEYIDYLETIIKDYDDVIKNLKRDKANNSVIKTVEGRRQKVVDQLQQYLDSIDKVEKVNQDEYEPFTDEEEYLYQDMVQKMRNTLTNEDQKELFDALLNGYTQTEWGNDKGYGKKKVIRIKKELVKNISEVDPDIAEAINQIQG